jgi:putative RNA 2'-phosphotransferase
MVEGAYHQPSCLLIEQDFPPIMKHRRSVDKLSKFIDYILSRQPDEFGLIPDENGFVKIKDLIKSLSEEPGWRHVRLNHIREAIYTTNSPTVEMENNLIRAKDNSHLFAPEIPDSFPKLLYYPVRQRAYPVLLEKGLPLANSRNRIVLASDIAMARRLGRRIDPSPAILTVNSALARDCGATLWRFGKRLFLSDSLPLGSFSGPPLPKPRPEPKQDIPRSKPAPKTPGSYYLDLTNDSAANTKANKRSRQRKNEWKRDRARISRKKGNAWPDT